MNAIMTQYKKIALLAVAAIAMNVNLAVLADCSPCATAAAARSAAAAQAALIVAGKAIAREAELDAVPDRAPHGQLFNPYADCENQCGGFNGCDLNSKLQTLFNCCVNTNQQVRNQGHEAEKCCKKLNHKIDNIEDQLSVIESLIVSQSVAAAACCSITSAQINALNISVADQISVLGLSIADVLTIATNIFDCTCT